MILKRIPLIIIFFFFLLNVKAQPGNDNCAQAQFIHLPSTGDTCFITNNNNATSDGYFNTCDQSATFPLPPGGNEIWYTYVATGDSNNITVIPIPGVGAMVDPSLTVITGSCGSFSTLLCDNPLNGTAFFNIPAGTQVWFYITALTTDGGAYVCIQSAHNIVYAGNSCATATNICDKLKTTVRDTSSSASGGMIASCFSTPPAHTMWLKFTVGRSGSFEFIATPNGPQSYHWALWDITNGCGAGSMTPVSCNVVYAPGYPFGMIDTATSCTSPFCPSVPVVAGNTYALMIDDTTVSHQGFDIEWGGTFEIAPTSDFSLSDDYICGYDSITVTYTGNASASALYNWSFGGAIATALTSQSYKLKFPAPGNYVIKLQVAEGGCAASGTARQVIVNPVPVATAGSDLIFCSNTGQYIMGLPPVSGYQYQWIDTLNVVSPDSSQTLVSGINNSTVPYVLTYNMVATIGMCHDTDDVKVTIQPRQSPFFQTPSAQCFNENSFDFQTYYNTVPGSTFNWTFQNGQPATANTASVSGIRYNAPGQYHVTLITHTIGCPADTLEDDITVLISPSVSFYASQYSGCPPLQLNLINTSPPLAGGTYLWNPNNGVLDTTAADSISVTYQFPGLYYPTLTLTTADHCSTTDTIDTPIEVFPFPDASFTTSPLEPTDFNPLVTFSNSEPNGVCYYNFGDGDSSIDCQTFNSYPDTGHYQVQLIVTNTYGCIDTTYQVIEISKFFTLYIPNAFSPNNDARNDSFVIKGDGLEDYRLRIFNRRGQMVFQSENQNISWNGSHLDTGTPVPDGVYVYDLRVEDSNHKKHQYYGSINLIR